MHYFTRQSVSFHAIKYGRLRNARSYLILPLIINKATLTIVLSRNSVRVDLLIAQGWRGTSLPRVSIHKGIQRHRCWAFFNKTWL